MPLKTKAKKVKTNYFSEKEVINLVRNYKITKSNTVFKQMSMPIDQMIEGMMNKEFYYNEAVKLNRSDIKSECFFEILKSLEKYDPDKGRVFAYFNRIVKNTILRHAIKNQKRSNKEMSYTNFSKNREEELSDDMVLNLGKSIYHNEETFSEQETIQSLRPKKSLSSQESYFIVYNYIKILQENLSIYIDNQELKYKLLEDVKKDPNVTFDFSKYSQSNLLNDNLVITRILTAINITLSELLIFLQKKFSKSITSEPLSFNAKIQQRTINTIKNYVNNSIAHSKLTSSYSIEDVIQLIRYIIDRNLKYDLKSSSS